METGDSSSINWKPLELRPEIFSIFLVLVILIAVIVYYNVKIRKLQPKETPTGLVLVIFDLINYFKDITIDIIGVKFVKFTPYIITLFIYIAMCNMIGIFGFENPTASITVTFSMGLVTIIGSFVLGIRYQKASFFLQYTFKFSKLDKKTGQRKLIPYFLNPLGLMGNITPLISISLRLWANIFAGALILSLIYSISLIFAGINPLESSGSPWLLIMAIFVPPFHAFFDLLVGIIQSYVFVMLTISYWNNVVSGAEKLNEQSTDFLDESKLNDNQKISVNLTSVNQI